MTPYDKLYTYTTEEMEFSIITKVLCKYSN